MKQIEEINLSQWVELYTNDMYSWALHKVSDEALAQDLVQDTFLVAAEKSESFKGESSAKTWLFSILNHKIIDVYRKKVRQPVQAENQFLSVFFDSSEGWKQEKQPLDWDDDEEHLLDNVDFRKVLKKCMDALPEKWNTCMKLKYLSELSGESICQELDIAPTNLWQIVHRAKLQLRECIENKWFKN